MACLFLVRATPLIIVPWLTFIAVGLVIYTGFVKIAARFLRYKVSWKSSFLFAVIVLILVIFDHVLAFDQPVATRVVHAVLLLFVLVILGSWFFSARGLNRSGLVLGWSGGVRLVAVAFALMVVVVVAIVFPAQVFLSKHLSAPP
jgi:hypothetical protein